MIGCRNKPLIPTALILAASTLLASACEPILPLAQLVGGATAAGPLFFLNSLSWLGIAVAIKCASFAFLEPRLSRPKAVSFMLIANVLSTIPGLLIASFAGALPLLALPLIFGLGLLAEVRVSGFQMDPQTKSTKGKGTALALTAAYILSCVMFFLAQHAFGAHSFAIYWVITLVFAGVAVSVGRGISAVLQ